MVAMVAIVAARVRTTVMVKVKLKEMVKVKVSLLELATARAKVRVSAVVPDQTSFAALPVSLRRFSASTTLNASSNSLR